MADVRQRKVGAAIKGISVLDAVKAVKARAGEDGYNRVVAALDDEARQALGSPLLATSWYPLDAFVRFLRADLAVTAGGDERVLVERSEAVIDRQLRGIYRLFIKLGSPEFVLKRISTVHMAYFNGITAEIVSLTPGRGVIRYIGFEPEHRLIGHIVIGFFRKALAISGAKDVHAAFATPIGAPEADLVVTWR